MAPIRWATSRAKSHASKWPSSCPRYRRPAVRKETVFRSILMGDPARVIVGTPAFVSDDVHSALRRQSQQPRPAGSYRRRRAQSRRGRFSQGDSRPQIAPRRRKSGRGSRSRRRTRSRRSEERTRGWRRPTSISSPIWDARVGISTRRSRGPTLRDKLTRFVAIVAAGRRRSGARSLRESGDHQPAIRASPS